MNANKVRSLVVGWRPTGVLVAALPALHVVVVSWAAARPTA
ncbi:MAG: hypothetical protein ACYTF6_01730 [Planctomycetota bacterium]|jgi:hypothetical protein